MFHFYTENANFLLDTLISDQQNIIVRIRRSSVEFPEEAGKWSNSQATSQDVPWCCGGHELSGE